MTLPIPTLLKNDIYELDAAEIKGLGVSFLLMDLDNTLSPYHIHAPTPELRAWIASLQEAGLELFILSNNHGDRPRVFALELGLGYINRAGKPRCDKALEVIFSHGYSLEQTALLGDQIYTDVLCAARGGFKSICVKPICISRNPFMALRYFLELPFRFAYKLRA